MSAVRERAELRQLIANTELTRTQWRYHPWFVVISAFTAGASWALAMIALTTLVLHWIGLLKI